MTLMRVLLNPGNDGHGTFTAFVTEPTQIKEKGLHLPFDDDGEYRKIILRALTTQNFDPTKFSQAEQEWMLQVGLLSSERDSFHPEMATVIGQALYQSLFPEHSQIRSRLHSLIEQATPESEPLHLQLQFWSHTERRLGLHYYPWELLHDGRDFLSLSGVTISRHIAYDKFEPPGPRLTANRLNVLLISSGVGDQTNGLTPLPNEERVAIREVLSQADTEQLIHLDELLSPTLTALEDYLIAHQGDRAPHVIHFDGHGIFGKNCVSCGKLNIPTAADKCANCGTSLLAEPQGYLLFEHPTNGRQFVSAQDLRRRLQFQPNLALVVLGACDSAWVSGGTSIFNGVAQSLIDAQIPAVVAMQFSATVRGASIFVRRLYSAVNARKSLAEAVRLGRISMDGDRKGSWYPPVLYLRWKDNVGGQLFDDRDRDTVTSQMLLPPVPALSHAFVGLIHDRTVLAEKLQVTTNQVTIAIQGMGGLGKTTLALQIGHDLNSWFTGGIFWAELRWYSGDPEQFLNAWAVRWQTDVMDMPDLPSRAGKLRSVLSNYINKTGPILIVLDNVPSPAAEQADPSGWIEGLRALLSIRPAGTPVLLTLREAKLALELHAEVHRLELLSNKESVELLTVIAGSIMSEDPETTERLANVVGHLPLGLRLAASLAVDSANEPGWRLVHLCERIEKHPVQELTLDQPELQRVFELSYAALASHQQVIFRLLGVLAPAPFDPLHVAGILARREHGWLKRHARVFREMLWNHMSLPLGPIGANKVEQIEQALKKMVSLALLEYDRSHDRPGLYVLHPLLRDYAALLLDQAGEGTKTRQGYIVQYRAFVEARAQLTPDEIVELDAELPNILSALDMAYREKQWNQVVALVWAMDRPSTPYLQRRGYLKELDTRLQQGIQAAETINKLEKAYTFMGNWATLRMNVGDSTTARKEYVRVKKRFEDQKNYLDAAMADYFLGQLAEREGDYATAERLYKQCLELAERVPDPRRPWPEWLYRWLRKLHERKGTLTRFDDIYVRLTSERNKVVVISALTQLAGLKERGQHDDATKDYHEQRLTRARELRYMDSISHALGSLASLAYRHGDKGEAERLRREIWQILNTAITLGDKASIAAELARLAWTTADHDEAIRLYTWSLERYAELRDQENIAYVSRQLGHIYQEKGDYVCAQELFENNLDIQRTLNKQQELAEALYSLGDLAYTQLEYAQALRFYQQSLDISKMLSDQASVAHTTSQLASLFFAQDDFDNAVAYHKVSAEIRRQLDHRIELASDLQQLGSLAQLLGHYTQAQQQFHESLGLFTEVGAQTNRGDVLTMLAQLEEARSAFPQARELYRQSLEIQAAQQNKDGLASAWVSSAWLAYVSGQIADAERLYLDSLHVYQELGDELGIARARNGLAVIAVARSNYVEGQRLYQQSLEVFEKYKGRLAIAQLRAAIGGLAQIKGEYGEAGRLFQESLEVGIRLAARPFQAGVLAQLAELATAQGDYTQAQEWYDLSLGIHEELNNRLGVVEISTGLALLAYLRGEYAEADRLYQSSLNLARVLVVPMNEAIVLTNWGQLILARGNYERAQQLCQQALILFEQLQASHQCAQVQHVLGILAQERQDYNKARRLYDQARATFDGIGARVSFANTTSRLGVLYHDLGDDARSLELHTQSLAIYEQLNDKSGIATDLRQLAVLAQVRGSLSESRDLLEQSLKIYTSLGERMNIANTLYEYARVEKSAQHDVEARQMFLRALQIYEVLGHKQRSARVVEALASLNQQHRLQIGDRS